MSKTNPNSYYDIEFEVEEVLFRNGLVEDIFYLKDLKQRKLFIAANISQETVEDAVRHIMQFNREDADIPRRNENQSFSTYPLTVEM